MQRGVTELCASLGGVSIVTPGTLRFPYYYYYLIEVKAVRQMISY